MPIYTSLHRAAKLHDKIEEMRAQLAELLDKARKELAASPAEEVPTTPRRGRRKMLKKSAATAAPAPAKRGRKPGRLAGRPVKAAAVPVTRDRRRSPLKGVKRSTSPSGPLAPAVVQVLETKKQPMNVKDILDGLTANGYQFNSAEPKKNLAARIYRLKGVKQVASGLFGIA